MNRKRHNPVPLVVWLTAQTPLLWLVNALALPSAEDWHTTLVCAAAVMFGQWLLAVLTGSATGVGPSHALPLVCSLGTPLLLVLPGPGWALLLVGAVYYGDLIVVALLFRHT